MRPRTLEEFEGQSGILADGRSPPPCHQGRSCRQPDPAWPPGVGKTTLARIIANHTRAHFSSLNAVLAGVKDLRIEVDAARQRLERHGLRTILFIDEVHRFNSAQQDALLPWVENGTVTLIGATTENPYFEVNKALVSRSRLFRLLPLEPEDLQRLLQRALSDAERGYGDRSIGSAPKPPTISWMSPTVTPAACSMPWNWRWRAPGARCRRHGADRPGDRRGIHPAAGRAVRQTRRCPLRHDQRLHQIAAGLGCRCGTVLAGPHGGSR